ncbi:MAG: AsmA-like C-terminal region-containing protein [Paenirhodobacter sp.]|uniref:AsmA-like C-terminal region-containing protein n=1 Tax=Paenirhodobacter sp. TaxID=1965326 RepID=UPI003D0A5639
MEKTEAQASLPAEGEAATGAMPPAGPDHAPLRTAPSTVPSTTPSTRPRARVGIWLILSLPLIGLAALFGFLMLSHQAISAPGWLITRIEAKANAALDGRLQVSLGGADVVVDEGFAPHVRLRNVLVKLPSGLPLAILPELRGTLRPEALLQGRIEPKSFRIRGGTVALRRLPDGRIDIDLGGAGSMPALQFDTVTQATDAIEAAFATPVLARLEEITAEDLRIRLDDARLGKVWQVSDGSFRLSQDAAKIGLTLAFDVGERDKLPAQVALSAWTSKSGPEAEFGAAVTDVPAADLAVQSPALAMLGLLDAPISGSFRTTVDAAGAVGRTEAELRIGAGALSPSEGARPVPFESAGVHLSYDMAAQRVAISQLSFQSRALRLKASGQTLLRDFANGLPREALTQIALRDIEADPEGLFVTPARISQGAIDLRMRLDPFRVEIGQLELAEGDRHISARGTVSAGKDGWRVAFDAGIDHITNTDLLALWPPALVPPTRHWLAENVATGELRNARAALRLTPGAEPRFELGYEFRGAEVTILRTLPPVREGRGFATIHDNTHALMVEEGSVEAPSGGRIEVADSVMRVPDIRERDARAEVRLVTRAPIPAALSLLDQEPFRFLSKAGKSTDIAEGWAEARTDLRFRMKKKITPEDVDFDVLARLTDVHSDKVVPGKVIAAPELRLTADRSGMVIGGRGSFDSVPFDARWSQRFGPEAKGRSAVDGYVKITPEGLDQLGIALPKGSVKGAGWGHLALDLVEGKPPRYDFESDLVGLALAVPEVSWAKPAGTKGHLALAGALGTPATVERLALSGAGLSAEGRLTLSAKGGFERAQFSKLAIGSWFSGSADLIGRGAARAPDVSVTGGRLDLSKARFGTGAGKAGSGAGNRVTAALDRLVISEGIALAPFRGDFSTRGGFSGAFSARVNGGASIEGAVGPAANGRTAVHITGPDAGAALASAGIFSKARGGALDLTLSPIGAASYSGAAKAHDIRVKDAPVLASMLSAVSVVGLLEQLNGEGILFSEAEAAFRLTPGGLSVTSGQATGASMAVTMAGNYYFDTGTIDMQGVISPLYLLNGIGQVVSRKGEGLFGFTYGLGGTAAAPKVTINPLSILTPGMFREIFRRTPPKLKTE